VVLVFILGDLQIDHVFVDDAEAPASSTGPRSPGDAAFDLATLTLGHPEHLGDIIAGYGTDIDLIGAWWSLRCLTNVRWLVEHGYWPLERYLEFAVLRSRL
jgi:hypothetical protein